MIQLDMACPVAEPWREQRITDAAGDLNIGREGMCISLNNGTGLIHNGEECNSATCSPAL